MLLAGGTRKRRSKARAAVRFVAAVMTTSGVLLLLDAGATLAWQEPVSALLALQDQAKLGDELDEKLAEVRGQARGDELSDAELEQLAERYEGETAIGEAWGRIELPSLGADYVVVEGTDEASLQEGPGHYPETALPGEGRTIAIAGHRTTYLAPFRSIDQLGEGDEIVIEMPWARFTYTFEEQLIVEPSQTEVTDTVGHERLVLSACHPLYSAAQRIVVFAKLEDVKPA
jgi:sortase A